MNTIWDLSGISVILQASANVVTSRTYLLNEASYFCGFSSAGWACAI